MDNTINSEKILTQRVALILSIMASCYIITPVSIKYYINIVVIAYLLVDLLITCLLRIHHDWFIADTSDNRFCASSDTAIIIQSIILGILYYFQIVFTIISVLILIVFGSVYLKLVYQNCRERKIIESRNKQFNKFLDLLTDLAEMQETKNDRKDGKS